MPLRLKPSPRVPSKRTLWLLAGRGKQAALDAIARVHERYADSPEPWCYHGEIHLYLGEYVEARRAFDTALSIYKRTRWAFIGLAAVELLEGRPDVAIATLRRGSEMAPGVGPTTYVYRGEALLRLGRLDEAIADLEHATRSSPSRVGAWIDLALARDQKGDGHAFAEVFERLRQQAPDLLAEAAREQGLSALHPPADRAAMRALFEHLLVMLRGNRSSTCVTWFTRAGALRVVPATFQLDENYVRRELGALRSIVEKHAGAVPPQREHREG